MSSPIADTVFHISVEDKELDLFGGRRPEADGVSCNSYVILDERTAVIYPVNERAAGQWLLKLKQVMNGEPVDYLVISHVEAGYEAAVREFMKEYPEAKLVGNAAAFAAFDEKFCREFAGSFHQVSGDSQLELGHHVLQFFLIPSDECPEIMLTYESMEGILFSSDRAEEYGKWSEVCMERTEELPIQIICPMYGPLQEGGSRTGSVTKQKERTGNGKVGFWKRFSGIRVS